MSNSEIEKEYSNLEEKCKALQQKIDSQNEKLKLYQTNILELIQTNTDLISSCEELKKEINTLLPQAHEISIKSQQSKLEEEISQLKELIQQKDEKIKILEQKIEQKDASYNELCDAITNNLQINVSKEDPIDELIKQIENKTKSLLSQNESKTQETNNDKTKEHNNSDKERIEELEDKLNTAELSMLTLKEQYEQVTEELDNQTIIVQNLQKERGLMKQNQVILQSQLRESMNKAEKNRKEAAEVINDLKVKISHNDEFREKILERLKELNIENKMLRDKLGLPPPSLPKK